MKPETTHTSFDIETDFLKKGYKIIAGIDEAGRGALAGHLSVGLVIYASGFFENPHTEIIESVRDSKMLSPQKRKQALGLIKRHSRLAAHTLISHRIIDRINVNRATEYAIHRLLAKIPVKPDLLLLDGKFRFNLGIPCHSIVKGDSLSISIASASIVAKVRRDEITEKFDLIYPGYSFKKNKGYGTAAHLRALREIGPCPIHRISYEPVAGMTREI